MRLAIVSGGRADWSAIARAMHQGVNASGDEAVLVEYGAPISQGFDAVATWGWRRGRRIFERNRGLLPVLVMERGYLGNRFEWTSLGWNGLNGRAKFPEINASWPLARRRFERNFGDLMKPWQRRDGYALIMGQVPNDASCANVNMPHFYRSTAAKLLSIGYQVRFRPHPLAPEKGTPGYTTKGTLQEDLGGAALVVNWNSNSGVDAVLAGVPLVACDEGSMAWEVASHSLDRPVIFPDRTDWAARLAWKQWLPSELADGSAWRTIREAKP